MGRAAGLVNAGILLLLSGFTVSLNLRFPDDSSSISTSKHRDAEIEGNHMKENTVEIDDTHSKDSEPHQFRKRRDSDPGMQHCSTSNVSSTNGGPGVAVSSEFKPNGHVYGGSQQKRQYWPLDNLTYDEYPYVISHQDNQAIAERYWLSSNGEYMYIGPASPLFIQKDLPNDSKFEFKTESIPPFPSTIPPLQQDTRCQYSDPRLAHEGAVRKHFKKPSALPDTTTVQYPTWSTSARYGKSITQDLVLQFAKEIVRYDFKGSRILIDGSWETCFGSLVFDERKFPDVKELSVVLRRMGFELTLTLHPFVNKDCDPYYTLALDRGHFVKSELNKTDVTWWNGEAGVIDFTNVRAQSWWRRRIEELMDTSGINSLQFDAGETSWLPQPPVLYGDKTMQPNSYTQAYAQMAAEFGNRTVLGVGFLTQDLPVFVRMQSKDSRWDFENGLATLVTTLFQMNMAGYPFVLPDKVGGSGGAEGAPSKELFIRWLQAAVFMPAIQFSHVPWDYDNETIAIAKNFTRLHEKLSRVIVRAMEKARDTGSPVNFPIWWISPEDPEALVINDEFLLGEDIIVAPVLKEGARSRDIYLPKGLWADMQVSNFSTPIKGPIWLKNYSAGIEVLPYFVKNSSLKMVCEADDHGGDWCTGDGNLVYPSGALLFAVGASVILIRWL